MPVGAAQRTRHVEHCMGTVFTIDIRDPGPWDEAVAEVVTWLHRVDRIFSTYREDSDISHLRRRELRLDQTDPLVAEVLDLCARVQVETGGYFSALWGDGIDPTGLVKGWAIERASELLRTAGSSNHGVNGGGDMQLAGEGAPGEPWQVGITDPADPLATVAVVRLCDAAIATSGTAERGAHVIDPFTGRAVTSTLSMTVVGSSLTLVDAYATATMAMGGSGIPWLEARSGYEGFVLTADGTARSTSGWGRLTGGLRP